MKFGGTSVSSAARWGQIRRLVERHRAANRPVVVVCSALAGVTDTLQRLLDRAAHGELDGEALEALRCRHLQLADQLQLDMRATLDDALDALRQQLQRMVDAATVSPRDHAAVMANGELLSTRLGATWLRQQGLPVAWRDARQLLRAQDADGDAQHYLSATCDAAPEPALQRLLSDAAPVVITQGFIARDARGDTVLLGRGGSDTAAAYLAAKLAAARLEIWTDVPGMFTANPSAVAGARLVPKLSYTEAERLAALGASVLHPRSLGALRGHDIPLHLGATQAPERGGTHINGFAPDAGIKAIVSRNALCMIAMRRTATWQPVGFMADVAGCFARRGISMDLLSSSPGEIRATVDTAALPQSPDRLEALMRDLSAVCDASITAGLASVSLVGHHLREDADRYARAAAVLHRQPAQIVAHAADDSSVTCVVDDAAVRPLVTELHRELFERNVTRTRLALGPSLRQLEESA